MQSVEEEEKETSPERDPPSVPASSEECEEAGKKMCTDKTEVTVDENGNEDIAPSLVATSDQPPSEDDEEEEEKEEEIFEIKRILDVEKRGDEKFFLVQPVGAGNPMSQIRWKGYNSANDSWEPESNLDTASQSLAEFRNSAKGKRKLAALVREDLQEC